MAGKFNTALELMSRNRFSFVLVNSAAESYEPCFDGLLFRVPGRDEVIEPKGNLFASYQDPVSKAYIPGTLLIHDIYEQTQLGERLSWNSRAAARHLLGVTEDKNGKFTYEGTFGIAGVSVVLEGATKEEVEEARKGGMDRYKDFELGKSLIVIQAHESRNAVRVKHGLDPIAPSPEYQEAQEIVGALQERRRKKILSRFDLEPIDRTAAAEISKSQSTTKPIRTGA